jgi:hypothetical protein
MPRPSAGLRGLALILPVVLIAACSGGPGFDFSGGGGDDSADTTAPKFYPLTGLPVENGDTADRPAVIVKIENSARSRPQAGLDVADVVLEAVVEGGQTRFLAVFHSTDSDPAGPVRSVRPADPSVVAPFGGVVAYSGGIPRFVEAMRQTGLTNVNEDNAGGAFRRRSDRAAPHNLYTSTEALREKGSDEAPPPKFAEFLKPGEAFNPPGATPVAGFTLAIGMTTTVDFAWDAGSGGWTRSTDGRAHTAESGNALAPTTVIVQSINYEDSGEVDTSGAAVSEAKVVGSGDAVVFANGLMLPARWSKTTDKSMTTWTDAGGGPLSLPAGRTWVELSPVGAALTTR